MKNIFRSEGGEGASFAALAAEPVSKQGSDPSGQAASPEGSNKGNEGDSGASSASTPTGDAKEGGGPNKDGQESKGEPGVFGEGDPFADGDDDSDTGTAKKFELPPELAENPTVAEHWANVERGVQKLVDRYQARNQELDGYISEYRHWNEAYIAGLQDPSRFEETLERIRQETYAMHGRQPGAAPQGAKPAEPPGTGEGASKYGLTYATDDKIVDVVLDRVTQEFEKRLGPISKTIEAQQTASQLQVKAGEVLPKLTQAYGDWVTPELVKEALEAFPGIDPVAAFGAKHQVEIARKAAEYAASRGGRSAKPPASSSNTQPGVESPGEGSSFRQILASEARISS